MNVLKQLSDGCKLLIHDWIEFRINQNTFNALQHGQVFTGLILERRRPFQFVDAIGTDIFVIV